MFNYEIFFRFYDKFKAQEFKDIDPDDPLVMEMNEKLKASGQIFHISDLIKLEILYFCGRCHTYFGVDCENISPATYMEKTHPDDIKRHALGRSTVFKAATGMYVDRSSEMKFISTHFKTETQSGKYTDLLYQMCIICSDVPHKTVHSIQVNTDVSGLLANEYGYHYYSGNDASFFRYPDKKLMAIGNVFSKREFEILKCIARGMESREIAAELFLSVHTVNTHRRNLLLKSGKRSTHELVIELQDAGVI